MIQCKGYCDAPAYRKRGTAWLSLRDKYEVIKLTGFNQYGFKKCRICDMRLKTKLVRCPCCNAVLKAWNCKMAKQDQPKIKENIFEKPLPHYVGTSIIKNDVDLFWHILTEREVLRNS